jgi:MFS family permease
MFSLGWCLVWTLATAFSCNFDSFVFFRFMTGIDIGGEYAAINSAIDELIPARRRGWTDLAINGSWWVGTAIGSAASLYLLNDSYVNPAYGWRICFGMGAVLAISVLFIRKNLPESPRYLMTHGRFDEADERWSRGSRRRCRAPRATCRNRTARRSRSTRRVTSASSAS